jgi:hypothetical protein
MHASDVGDITMRINKVTARGVATIGVQLALALLLVVTCVARAGAQAPDALSIVVTALKGDVRLTVAGEARAVQKGTIIELPATLETGKQSSIDLQQDHTTVSIAAQTRIELPASAAYSPIERIIQTSGNTFYAVGKRNGKKLRVETPYLVAVIKGTQFNVAVQSDGASVSLFEGHLEVRAPDDSDVVDLNAGEMAIRQSTDKTIRVIRMNSGEAIRTPGTGNDSPTRSASQDAPRDATPVPTSISAVDELIPGRGVEIAADVDNGGTSVTGNVTAGAVSAGAELDAGEGSAKAGAEVGLSAPVGGVGIDAAVTVAPAEVSIGTGVNVETGIADANVSAGVVVDAGGAAASIDASLDTSAAAVDVGATADIGAAGATLDVGAGVDAGGVAADLGATTTVDVGAGTVGVGVDAAVDTGVAAVGTGIDAGADLGSGTVDVGADTSIDLGVVEVGVDAAVDVGSGGLDTGIDVDLDTTSEPVAEVPVVGGLLGGLTRRIGGT